jgi:peptide subunit release factor 1 (eRF1)
MISSREIRALVEVAYKNVVISLYLHLSPEKLVPNAKGLVRSFHSLKSSVAEKRQEFIRLLPRQQKRVMSNDMAEIEAFLGDYPVPKGMRSLVIFKSGAVLNRVMSLPVRSNDKLVIDPDPYVTPLEATLEENERVLAVEVSKERSEFFVYHLGYFQKVDRIKSFVPKDSVDASIPGRVQRHRLTHLQWHLKLTARKCSRLYSDWSCRALVLMGEQRVSHLLEEFLHETLKESIIGRIYGSHKADYGNAKAEIEKELRTYKEQREVEAVRELTDYNPDVVAAGLHDVIEICNLFLARRLFISDGLHQQGFVCRAHHYVSLDERQCPFCRAALMPVENLIDEILEIARMHGVNVTMIEYRQDLMSNYDGIAGVTYVPVHRN